MVALWIIIVTLCLLVSTGSALIALRLQYRSLDNARQEREAWQQAQEGRQRTWEVRQGKHILDAEKKLADQLKEARREWRDWGSQVLQENQEWRESADGETELARLPHIEQVELAYQGQHGHLQPKDWQPPRLYRAELAGRDLSYRYLDRADLREARLTAVNFSMADLTGASLTGANLQQANLTGANLSGADLRGADLSGANLLVADLHNTVLHGANLSGARNLTPVQLQTAIYDSTTRVDSFIDITLPRIPGVLTTPPELLATTAAESPGSAPFQAKALPVADPSRNASELQITAASPETSDTPAVPEVSTPAASHENEAPAQLAETSTPIVPETNAETPAENTETLNATGKKSGAKKRASKTRQAASNAQPPASKQGPGAEKQLLPVASSDEPDEDERPTGKIIQLQPRAPKTRPLPGSSEQKKQQAHAN